MTVVGKKLLNDFALRHASARAAIRAWVAEAEAATWQSTQDVRARFPSASVIGGDRIVFKLKGNDYRLDVQVSFGANVMFVRRIGTHAEYDSWTF